MVAINVHRVQNSTCQSVNQEIRRQTIANVERCLAAGRSAIDKRLAELDQEWDIERTLETMAPTITLVGICLGFTRDRRWLLLPALVNSFFLQHALQGWCPPLPVLRRLGFRTVEEIDRERYALMAGRGDFRETDHVPKTPNGLAHRLVAKGDH